MQSTTKPCPPVPSGSERVHDQGGGTGQLGLRVGGAKNLWVKKNRRNRVNRLKIATYNVRTLLRDEHIQELEEELRETRLVWDVIGISEVRRPEECFTTLQSGPPTMHKSINGQSGVGFLINRKWKEHIVRVNNLSPRVAELVSCLTKRYKLKIVQIYAPTTSYSEEDITSFYNNVDETLGKPNHYTIVMGDFNAQIGKRTNPMKTTTGKFGLEMRNERGDALVEWATSRK